MYKKLKGDERHLKRLAKRGIVVDNDSKVNLQTSKENISSKPNQNLKEIWFIRIKVLSFSALFGAIANTINTSGNVGITTSIFSISIMIIPIILGCIVNDILSAKLNINFPIIIYISLIGIIMSIPGVPFYGLVAEANNAVALLPLTTPILAYAGISLGKDLRSFKQQGLAIICITLLAFTGTYLGSAIIAHVFLTMGG